MRKKKGAALPTAIFLCSFMLIISISVATILLLTAMNNKISNIRNNYEIIFSKSTNEFIANVEVSDHTFNWEIYEKEDNANVKALAAYNNSDKIRFYTIYDFENNQMLAYQSSNLYITYADGAQYLGGIVKVSRS